MSLLAPKIVVVSTFALAACGSGDDGGGGKAPSAQSSCELETRALRASFSAQARGASTKIYAALFAEREVALECGDTFAATVGGQRVVLAREEGSGGGPFHYTATIPSPDAATTLTLALERPAPKASAPLTRIHLPARFAVRDASTSLKVSSTDDPRLRLDPPIDAAVTQPRPDTVQLRLSLDGSCLEPLTFTWSKAGVLFPPAVAADGTVTMVNIRQFLKRKGADPACDVALAVTTFTAGELDPAFSAPLEGGSAAEGSRHEETSLRLKW